MILFLTAIFSFSILFIYLAYKHHINYSDLFAELLLLFYLPHHNNCYSGIIFHTPLYLIIYIGLLLFLILIQLCSSCKILKGSTKNMIITGLFFYFFIIISFQTTNQFFYFAKDIKNNQNKNLPNRLAKPERTIYFFAESVKHTLPQKSSAELITDMDINKEPGMYYHRLLSYYLYPVDIRRIRKQPLDYLILFEKNDAPQHVLRNYKTLVQLSPTSLIAQKETDE